MDLPWVGGGGSNQIMLRSLYPPTNLGSSLTLCIESEEFILEASLAEKLMPLCGVISIEIFNVEKLIT